MASYAALLGWPPDVVGATPWSTLELAAAAKLKQGGKSFRRQSLLPHEQAAKAQGLAFAKRLANAHR